MWDPDYRARWVEEVCQATAETAFDGVMADNDVFDDYYGLDLPLDGIADTAALRAELNIFVDQAGAGLNAVGKILMPNVAEARREPGRWERHSAWGGGFDECWLGWGDDHLFDETTALAQIHELRGPGLLKNFWRNPIATADSHDGDWLRTGIAARVDGEGRIHLV